MEYHSGKFGIKGQSKACVLATLSSTEITQNDIHKGSLKTCDLGGAKDSNDSKQVESSFAQPK